MKISVNSIKGLNARYHTTNDIAAHGVDALVAAIGSQLGGVDDVENIGEKYQGIIVSKIMECYRHPDSDHLNVCKIDDAGKAQDVARDEQGYVQVVCGAPNAREGLLVAWLPPGTTVPESVAKDPFVLGSRELRGVMSNGMLASPRELALGDSHEGILEIIDHFDSVHAGDDFAEAFELKDDVVIDIENKMFTHRPDCFGFLGVSRELAGIQGMQFRSPDWYQRDITMPAKEADELELQVTNELPELVPRFTMQTMRDVTVGPSPTWLLIELSKVGVRSINNIVDYTNFFMLETGQPLHAYDYDKVAALTEQSGANISVRHPRSDEKILLLNGKEIVPRAEAIMIASGDHLIGLAGVMGGADTEVDEDTKNIILEAGSFDMYSIRRTSMTHGLFTEAVTRFNKGQSPLQNKAVMAKIVSEIRQFASGKVAGEFIDVNQLDHRAWVHPPVPISLEFINARLGLTLDLPYVRALLEHVEFTIDQNGDDAMTVTAPFWRTDIETREDVVEEVGRLHGFDRLPLELPKRNIKPAAKDDLLELKQKIRTTLASFGANETLNYSFVHGDLLQKVGQNPQDAFSVSNALSPDLQYYRLSLTPSLLEKVHPNSKAGYDRFALFEFGKSHYQGEPDTQEPEVPNEDNHLAVILTYSGKDVPVGAPYYYAKNYLEQIMPIDQITFVPLQEFDLKTDLWGAQLTAPYDPGRSAVIIRDEQIWGVVGEFRANVRKAFKLPAFTAGLEVHLDVISNEIKPYVPIPRFPKVMQDLTLEVTADASYATVFKVCEAALAEALPSQTVAELLPKDIYQADGADVKRLTFRLEVSSYERTLTDAEVGKLIDVMAGVASSEVAATKI